jgi:formylglycine-generating enzyme required for sulfatase activity
MGHPTGLGNYPDGQSPYGAMDMLGNVRQWCLMPWGLGGTDVSASSYRLLKGVAWNVSNPDHLRALTVVGTLRAQDSTMPDSDGHIN